MRRFYSVNVPEFSSGVRPIDVMKARERLSGIVRKSPLDRSPLLSKEFDCDVFLKKEHISLTGSYKERGALNKLLLLTPEERAKGVICSSAGNHAQAISHHSTRLGIDGLIVMPITTPYVKVASTEKFGGKVLLHGENYDEAYARAKEISDEEGRTFVHAFDDPQVVAGQGTVALEILEENPYIESIVVPVGGGGLIAGMALVLKHINPKIKIYGVEAKNMPKMKVSVDQGEIVKIPRLRTMADGIAIQQAGKVPFEIISKLVEDIVVVDEDEIAAAILTLLEIEKTVVEGSGATGLAALANKKLKFRQDEKVAVVLTGGNIDMSALGRIIEKGLVKDGRLTRLRVTVEDSPGELSKLTQLIGSMRANIRDIVHERAFMPVDISIGYTSNILTLETRGPKHVDLIIGELRKQGYRVSDWKAGL